MDKRKSSSAVTLDLLISFWQKRQIMHSLSRMICRRSCGVLSSKAISLWDEIQIAIKCDVNMFHILLISFFSSSEPKYLSRKVSICLTVILGNKRMLFALYRQKFLRKKFCEKKIFFVGIAPETIPELRMHFSVMQKKFYGMHSRLRYSLRRYTDKNFYEKKFAKKNLIFVGIAPNTISELRTHFFVMQKKFCGMHSRLRFSLRRYTDKNFYEKNFTKKILRKKIYEKKIIFHRYSAGDHTWAASAFFRNAKKILRSSFATQI
jgi:hypothetical protein